MCKKFHAFFVALATMCCIAVCGGLSVTCFADETSLPDDFVGPVNTTTTTEPVDYTESGPLGWIGTQIQNLGTAIDNAFQAVGVFIIDGLTDIFVPEDGYLDAKFNALKERFAFAESIADTVQVIINWFDNASLFEPPVVTVNLSNGTSAHGVNYGTSAKILDFSWYAPYKPTIDVIISAFLWLFFIWRIYLSLPNIIAGVAPQAIFDTNEALAAGKLNADGLYEGMYMNHQINRSETAYRWRRADSTKPKR